MNILSNHSVYGKRINNASDTGKKVVLFLFFLFAGMFARATNFAADSLYRKLNHSTQDTAISGLTQYLLATTPEESYHVALENLDNYKKYEKDKPYLYSRLLWVYAKACFDLRDEDSLVYKTGKTRADLLNEAEYNIKLSDGIVDSLAYPSMIYNNVSLLFQVYEAKKDYRNAFQVLKKFQEVASKALSQENNEKLATVEMKRQAEQYEYEISLKQMEIENNQKQLKFYIVAVFLLLIIASLLVFYGIDRRKKNKDLKKLNEEIKRSNANLAYSNAELEKMNELKSRLLGILNHDLKEPVLHLVEYLRYIHDRSDLVSEEEKKKMKQEILRQAEDLLQLMEELLVWSKSQMAHFNPNFQDVSVASLFKDLQSTFQAEDFIEIRMASDFCIKTDPHYMKVIIRNMTSNAIQAAMKSDDPAVCWSVISNESNTFLTIRNNGIPMTEGQKDILINGANPENISRGLGLHIIHDLAKIVDCTIEIDNEVKEGMKITLILENSFLCKQAV